MELGPRNHNHTKDGLFGPNSIIVWVYHLLEGSSNPKLYSSSKSPIVCLENLHKVAFNRIAPLALMS